MHACIGMVDYARDNYYLLFFYPQVSQYSHNSYKGACIILTKKLCLLCSKLKIMPATNPYTCRTLHIAYECGMSGANID